MKRISLLVVLTVLWCSYAVPCIRFDEFDSTATSVPSVPQHRGFFKTVGTVSMQTFVGTLGGLAGVTLIKVHPVVGGIGWIVGSSFGVYSVGDEGTGRGNFWWTSVAGTVIVLAFTPSMAEARGIGVVFSVGAAMITSLLAEIIVYHITEGAFAPRANVSITILDSDRLSTKGSSEQVLHGLTLTPCLTLSVSF